MNSRIVIGIVALTILLAAIAGVAAYFVEAVTPALAMGTVAAVLAALAFIVAGVALGRQQGVVSEQTSLAVLVDKSLVRMGRRIDEQEVKFAAARAVAGHRKELAAAAPDAPLPRADKDAIETPVPRTAIEVADTKPEPGARERHKAKFLPPADLITVEYESSTEDDAALVFGEAFEIALEPVVAIPSGNVAAYRVLAGFGQSDGSYAHVAETPPGWWGERGAAFGEALAAAAAATAQQHFDVAGDARLYLPIPAALVEDEQAARALAQRYDNSPAMARTVIAMVRTSTLMKGGDPVANRVTALSGAGAAIALWLDDAEADVATLAKRFGAVAVLAEIEHFPVAGTAGWLTAVMENTGALVVATGVRTEASVIAMMDLNVGYMSGPLFAEPKRLKASEAVPAET